MHFCPPQTQISLRKMKADSQSCSLPTWKPFYQLSCVHYCLNQLIDSLFFFLRCVVSCCYSEEKGKRPGYLRCSGASDNKSIWDAGGKKVVWLLLQVKDRNASQILMTLSLTLCGGYMGVNVPPLGPNVHYWQSTSDKHRRDQQYAGDKWENKTDGTL